MYYKRIISHVNKAFTSVNLIKRLLSVCCRFCKAPLNGNELFYSQYSVMAMKSSREFRHHLDTCVPLIFGNVVILAQAKDYSSNQCSVL